MVKKQQMGNSDVSLSNIIYGTWRLAEDSDTSKAAIQNKIEACLSVGITSFDHADIYGDYRCETLFGEAFKEMSEAKSLTQHVTKCDIALLSEKYPDRRVKHYNTSAQHIHQSVEQSLSLLGLDTMDLVLLHRPDPLMDVDETGQALDALVTSGKAKAVGVSNFKRDEWELLQSRMQCPLQANQIELSLLENQAMTNGDLSFIQKHRATPMAWSPLSGGRLFSNAPQAVRVRQRLESLATDYSTDISAVAIAWLLRHPAAIVPIIGTNQIERIKRITDATRVELSREDWFELYELSNGHEVP